MSIPSDQPGIDLNGGFLLPRTKGAFASRVWGNQMVDAITTLQAPDLGEHDHADRPPNVVYIDSIYDAYPGGGQYCATYRASEDLRVDVTKDVGATGESTPGKTSPCIARYEREITASAHIFTDGLYGWPGGIGVFYGWGKDVGGAATGDEKNSLPVFNVYEYPIGNCTTPSPGEPSP